MNGRDRQYIGILAENGEGNGRDNVFVNQQSYIQYSVKSLLLPETSNTFVAGYISSFDDEIEFIDDEYLSDEERIENYRNFLEDKMFIYNCKVKDGKYINMIKATLVEKPKLFKSENSYYSIPVFCSMNDEDVCEWERDRGWNLFRDYKDNKQFIDSIRLKKPLGSLFSYDMEAFTPSFVVWKNEDGKLLAVGKIERSRYNALGAVILESDNIFLLDLSDYREYVVYNENINPTQMYIPSSIYGIIENEFIKATVSDKEESQGNEVEEQQEEKIIEEKSNDVVELTEPGKEELIDINASIKNDELIINSMDYHSQKRSLYYSLKDFINVHTAFKSSNLVILSGLSGTGKSALVDIYTRALGVNQSTNPEENRLLFIPVRPSWNDDADLLGYVDLVHMVYRASDSGFVDFLVRAQEEENKNKLFFVCFDEMNLARVEHYFSQFLSILERPIALRELQLYDKQYKGRLYNSADYPNSIKIGDNIKFVGTVNVDESTYHFSDKVLDRANVIQLEVLDYSTQWKKKKYGTLSNVNWSVDDYNNIINSSEVNESDVQNLLWEIHVLLQKASSKYGVGPRIVKSIGFYLRNMPTTEIGEFTYADGLDYQIAQRVLTKVRGPETQLGGILDENEDDNLMNILRKYSELSHFNKCNEILKQKKKELETYGYCI